MVGAVDWHDRWLVGLLMRLIKALVLSWFVSQKLIMVGAKASQEDLATLHDLVRAFFQPLHENLRYLRLYHRNL